MRQVIFSLVILGTMMFISQCGAQAGSGPTAPATEFLASGPMLTPTSESEVRLSATNAAALQATEPTDHSLGRRKR